MASSPYPLGRATVLVMRLRNWRCAYTERAISKRREDKKGKRDLVGVVVDGVGGVGGRGRG